MYDHVTFHTDENPTISDKAAIAHIVYYYTWATSQNLYSQAAAQLPEFQAWQQGNLSGSHLILQGFKGGIDETCFNELGNRFTQFYYDDEDEGYGQFMEDYFVALDMIDEDEFYQIDWQPENQARLNVVFQTAFDKWYNSLK